MPTLLEKVKSQPDSMKARIFSAAQKLFAAYGYEGTTTRMIAADVGIDISTLYYHWGEKKELYSAVLENFDNEIATKLKEIESIVHGKSLDHRLNVAIDEMCDYLFDNIEVTKLILFSSFVKSKDTTDPGVSISEYISNVAVAMGMAMDKSSITPATKARVMAMVLSLFGFTSGETFLRPILDVDSEHYIAVVKETLKFILIPAFTQQTGAPASADKTGRNKITSKTYNGRTDKN
ncbi:MAG: TetR/AcrR family transcriptional regulator [Thermodesulfobacteriota bacterium]|nr:TetR/AcrR family transcriptional regulator [Thermodesulfobacteriota bacterium]